MTERRVVLVAGPPAAGKNTHVNKHKRPGDIVIDFDDICRRLGSNDKHDHAPEIRTKANRVMQDLDEWVSRRGYGTAWVIRSVPHPAERALLAQGIRATEVHVIATPADVAKARAERDGRPAWTAQVIDKWWRRYQPATDDHTITTGENP